MLIKWNLYKKRETFKKSDIIVLSIGKSGRTWLRVLVNKYLSLHYGIPFDLDSLAKNNNKIPYIIYSHEIWRHYSHAKLLQRLSGKYIIPDKILMQKKVILLYRDPRDVAVSLYFQKTKRSRRVINCSISQYIRHKKEGVRNIVKVLNVWQERLRNHPNCLWINYEDMKKNTRSALMKVLGFTGIENIRDDLIDETVVFADFNNMKKMEMNDQFKNKILRATDNGDPNSFKVREGKVGGYVNHFSQSDIDYLNETIKKLNNHYTYNPDYS